MIDTLPAVRDALNSAPASDEVFTYHATEYKLQKIRTSSAIDETIVRNLQSLPTEPTEEKTSLQIMATISQTTDPARYYVYTKDAKSYIVTESKIFLHVPPVIPPANPANPANFNFDVSAYLLLSSRITQKVANNNFKRMISGISSIKESGKSVYIAVCFYDDASSVYRAESDLFTYQGSTVTTSQTQQTTVTGATMGEPESRNQQPVNVVTPMPPNTPTPLPQSQQQMAHPSPTTLCTGPYSDPINRYNKASDIDSWFREGRTTIPCATIATDAKTKLTVTLTDGTFMKPGPFTFKDVAMENKEDKWFGFMMNQETKQWIQLEVKEKKLTYAACLDQCAETSSTAPTYRQKKDLEVKHDKDKKYTFEGGTVEYTEIDPFNTGMSPLKLGLIIGGSILGGIILLVVIAVLVFNRSSVANGVNAIATQMRDEGDNAFRRLQSWRGNANTSSEMDPLLTPQSQ